MRKVNLVVASLLLLSISIPITALAEPVSNQAKQQLTTEIKPSTKESQKSAIKLTSEVVEVEAVNVKNTTINTGDKWEPSSNFINIKLSNGTELAWLDSKQQMKINNNVDTSKPGTYKVTYSYNGSSSTATVTVKDLEEIKIQMINTKDSTLFIGNKWKPKDNFVSVMMSTGTDLDWTEVMEQVQVVGSVDTNNAGTYKVTYNYMGVSSIATITVKEAEVKEISVKNTNLPIGEKWDAKDNFNYVLLTDGTKLSWPEVVKQMQITGGVDSNKTGEYKITYNYLGKSAVATIAVKEMEELKVKNSKIAIGQKWDAKDNFVNVKMNNGVDLTWPEVIKQMKITGEVDTNKKGHYKVTYNYLGVSATANIEVSDNVKPIIDPVKPGKGKPTGILPQTGESTNTIALIFGGFMVLLTFGFIAKKLKKEEN